MVGITDESFPRCVTSHAYLEWTAYLTERALARGVSGTPTVFVAGVAVPANPDTIVAAVAAVMESVR
jgi:protein-disulfide isomerase